MTRPYSTMVCTVTPFDTAGRLDEEATTFQFQRLAAAGIGPYVGSSSPGEGYALSLAETSRLYELAHTALKGKVPVRAMGVEPHRAEDLQALIRLAEEHDLDAMQLYCLDAGHGNKPNEQELEGYFGTLLDNMSIPAVISSHVFAGYALSIDLIARLLDRYPGIIGINVTNPDLGYVARLIDTVDGRIDVHVGGPMQALTGMALGAQGFLGTEGNLAPHLAASVVNGYAAGDLALATNSYGKLIRLFAANTWPNGSMRWLKASMRVLGLPGWTLRPPWKPLGDELWPLVVQRLIDLDICEGEGLALPKVPAL